MSKHINRNVVECEHCGQHVDYHACGKTQRGNVIKIFCGNCGEQSEVME